MRSSRCCGHSRGWILREVARRAVLALGWQLWIDWLNGREVPFGYFRL
jgi:hypothetical protein